jgi:hypothetical protein
VEINRHGCGKQQCRYFFNILICFLRNVCYTIGKGLLPKKQKEERMTLKMALVTTTEMFKKAYEGGYAVGAFNVNNMEIVQAITEAADELRSPIILQCSAGARKYAKHSYLVHLVQAAIEETNIPIALHLDHGADFEICKQCIDVGFT